jgi:glucosamine-6-phosphate deaminase
MLNYYSIPSAEFSEHSKITFNFVQTHDDLCRAVAREIVDLLKVNGARGEMTKLILPIGPIDFGPLAELCNRENVSCESLVVLSMDEYCDAEGRPIPFEHPMSFRAFYQSNFLDRLDRDKKLPPEQLILPDPMDLDRVRRTLDKYGQVDITYGGMGINGHYAFNSPPRESVDLETFRRTTVRLVEPRESDVAQMAMGGSLGNLEIIPPMACSLGMSELLSAKMLHLTFMRTWHAGVLRRALFGPVTPSFPGSLVQLHPNVKATVTAVAAQLPSFSLLQSPGQ